MFQGKIYSKPSIFPLNMGLSCKVSLEPIHWMLEDQLDRLWKSNVITSIGQALDVGPEIQRLLNPMSFDSSRIQVDSG